MAQVTGMPFHEKYEKKEYLMTNREGIDINIYAL